MKLGGTAAAPRTEGGLELRRGTVSLAGRSLDFKEGRISFDGQGSLSGTASAIFRGLLLGNPVMGSYEAKSDCSVLWKMQDDSGGFQHFRGTLSSDGISVQFKQIDPGGVQCGIMQ